MENMYSSKSKNLNKEDIYNDLIKTKKLINDAFDYQYYRLRDRKRHNIYYEKGIAFAVYTAKFPKFIAKILFTLKSVVLYLKCNKTNYKMFMDGYYTV